MKKAILIITISIFLSLFLIGCSGQDTVYVCSNGSTVTDLADCNDTSNEVQEDDSSSGTTIKSTTSTVTTGSSSSDDKESDDSSTSTTNTHIDQEVEELMQRTSKVKSLIYDYRESSDVTATTYDTFLKGNIMKMYLPEEGNVLYQNQYDVIIFDLSDESSIAYCEDYYHCTEQVEYGEVDFDDYYFETPLDWMDKIRSAEYIKEQDYKSRDVTIITVNDEYEYWVDSFYAVPHKILKDDEVIVMFDNMLYNTVSDSDLEFTPEDKQY